MQGIRTRYIRIPDLLMLHDEASLPKQGIPKLLKKFSNYKLLILDEWLLNDLSDEEQYFLLELIERRHNCSSTIFCTQYKKEDWHARLGGGVHADAIMDRIVHNAVWVYAGNLNMREFYSHGLVKPQ
jgi:DNA replication protein DnaC